MDAEKMTLLKQLAQMGDVVLISNGNRVDLNENGEVPLKTQADAVMYFLQRLDINMVSSVLDDNRTYQDFKKSLFIKKLGDAVDEFINNGDTYLNRYDGACNSKLCHFNCKGFSFVGNNSDNYFDLIIDIKDGIVHDIYECDDFLNKNDNISKKTKIYIDDNSTFTGDDSDIPF